MSRTTRHKRSPDAQTVERAMRGLMALVAVGLAVICNLIFVGADLLLANLEMAGLAVLIAIGYAIVDARAGASGWLRFASSAALLLLVGIALWQFFGELRSGELKPAAAIKVSMPFCIFMAIAGRRLFDWFVFLSVCCITYVAGIWITPQPPGFVWLFATAAALGAVFLMLACLRHDVQRYRKLSRERLVLGLEPPKMRGRVPVARAMATVAAVVTMALFAAGLAFVLLPRPADIAGVFGDFNAGDDADSNPAGDGDDDGESNGNRPPSTNAVGLAENVELDRVGDLLAQKTPQYRVKFSTVRGEGPFQRGNFYLRMMAFDQFDGSRWTVSRKAAAEWESRGGATGGELPFGSTLMSENPAGDFAGMANAVSAALVADPRADRELVTVSATISPLAGCRNREIPLPYLATAITGTNAVQYNADFDLARNADDRPPAPLTVQAVNLDLSRTPILVANKPSGLVDGGRYLWLAADRSPRFRQLAGVLQRRAPLILGAPAATDFDKVMLVQRFFTMPNPLRPHGFTYSLERADVPADSTALEHFLFANFTGHCELFASAAVVLLREMNVSSRVVGGYLGGDFDAASNEYTIFSANAHLWIEVYFEGYGWFPFDPTPPTLRGETVDRVMAGADPGAITTGGDPNGNSANGSNGEFDPTVTPNDPSRPQTPAAAAATEADSAATTGDNAGENGGDALANPDAGENENVIGGFSASTRTQIWQRIGNSFAELGALATGAESAGNAPFLAGAAVIVATGAGLLIFVGVRWLIRRWRQRPRIRVAKAGVSEPKDAPVLSWYEQALQRLARLGLYRQPAQTPAEFAALVNQKLGTVGGPFIMLTHWFHATRYGRQPLNSADIDRLKQVWREFLTALSERERALREAAAERPR